VQWLQEALKQQNEFVIYALRPPHTPWPKREPVDAIPENPLPTSRTVLSSNAHVPSFATRPSQPYEAALCRQVAQTLFALDALDRRKPQERRRFLVIYAFLISSDA
jgi:hypothetical protein